MTFDAEALPSQARIEERRRLWWAVALIALPLPLFWPLELIGWELVTLVQVPVGIVLGRRGSEWAWRKWHGRKWATVEEFARAQRRWAWGGVAALIASIAVGAGALDPLVDAADRTSSEPQTFSGHGIRFTSPGDWAHTSAQDLRGLDVPGQESIWIEPFQLDAYNLVAVQQLAVPTVITEDNIGAWVAFAEEAPEPKGSTLMGHVEDTTLAGHPAMRVMTRVTTPDGVSAVQRSAEVFLGTATIRWDCQYTADHRAEVLDACDLVERTLDITSDFDVQAGWSNLDSPDAHLRARIPPQWTSGHPPEGIELQADFQGPTAFLGTDRYRGSLHSYTRYAIRSAGAGLKNPPTVVSRSSVSLPAGDAEAVHLRTRVPGGALHIFMYSLVAASRGYVMAVFSSEVDVPFLEPTAAAVAETIELKE